MTSSAGKSAAPRNGLRPGAQSGTGWPHCRRSSSISATRTPSPNNPVKGVKRPKTQSGAGATPTIGDHQARQLLAAPATETIKAKRDRAILSTLLFHALRREELCKLKVSDFRHALRGVPHLKVEGKGEKTRYIPIHAATNALIHDYIEAAGHGGDENGALFRPIKNNRGQDPQAARLRPMRSTNWCKDIRRNSASKPAPTRYAPQPPPMPSITMPTSPRCKDWLGHANLATTQLYDHRKTRPEDSPTFKVNY